MLTVRSARKPPWQTSYGASPPHGSTWTGWLYMNVALGPTKTSPRYPSQVAGIWWNVPLTPELTKGRYAKEFLSEAKPSLNHANNNNRPRRMIAASAISMSAFRPVRTWRTAGEWRFFPNHVTGDWKMQKGSSILEPIVPLCTRF